MTVANGTLRHTLTMHSETIAHLGSTSHGTGPIPTQPSMMFSSPLSVLKTNCHTTAITTDEMASGRKTMVRKTPMPLTFRVSTPATTRLISRVGTTVPRVKTTVLRMAMTKSGSDVKSSSKFLGPTNFAGLNTSQLWKLMYSENASGNSMNTATAARFGATKRRPAQARRRKGPGPAPVTGPGAAGGSA